MNKKQIILKICVAFLICTITFTNTGLAQKVNDSNTPLHLLKPDYDVPYGKPEIKEITAVLDRVYNYLDKSTPMKLVDKTSGYKYTCKFCVASACAGRCRRHVCCNYQSPADR